MKTKALNVVLYLMLAVMWCAIVFISHIFFFLNGIVEHFGNGILKIVFILVYICPLILTIIFHRKLKTNRKLPLCLLFATVVSIIFNGIIYFSVDKYVSVYSKMKWDNNKELRFYMIDSLEKQFDFIGKTEQEVTDILGEPQSIREYGDCRFFEYYIGSDYIDPYTYDFIFKNGIVFNKNITQH